MSFLTQGSTVNNVDTKDIETIGYSGTGLGAQTIDRFADGRTFRDYTLDVRYTAGGTLALKIYVSGEDVDSSSVSNWVDKTTDLLGAATVTASGFYNFSVFARWIKVEAVLTSTGNSLAYELWQGWGGSF
jgi:hypothetical protein